MNYAQIWEELERVAAPGIEGRVRRRVHPDARCDLFLAIDKPTNLRMVLMLVKEASLDGIAELPTGRGVEARITRPGDDGADAAVELVLTDPRSADILSRSPATSAMPPPSPLIEATEEGQVRLPANDAPMLVALSRMSMSGLGAAASVVVAIRRRGRFGWGL